MKDPNWRTNNCRFQGLVQTYSHYDRIVLVLRQTKRSRKQKRDFRQKATHIHSVNFLQGAKVIQ